MKKRVGQIFGKPIVTGDPNNVAYNEYWCNIQDDTIVLYERGKNGNLQYAENTYVEPNTEYTINEEVKQKIQHILDE